MITQKMKYALKAMLVLGDEAAQPNPEALTIEKIARRSDTPKRFLEQILLEIRNAGMVSSIRGRSGGYQNALKDAREHAMADMQDSAKRLGADAVIGIDLDYEVLGKENGMLMVSINGTAVRLG